MELVCVYSFILLGYLVGGGGGGVFRSRYEPALLRRPSWFAVLISGRAFDSVFDDTSRRSVCAP